MYKAGIITASDQGAKGNREDQSGQVLKEELDKLGLEVTEYVILADERETLSQKMIEWSHTGIDLIITAGGTGLSPRDVTPEATRDVIDKEIPGFNEEMRRMSIQKTPHAMLSRGVSGIVGQTIIINMPGSPKAVSECFELVSPALLHALETVIGSASDCAR